MNADNITLLSCGFPFLPLNPAKISSHLYAVFVARVTVNVLTCPVIILLNTLVMVAVKTRRQLRTKSNIALGCLATTDLVVGLVVQPLNIASSTLFFKGNIDMFCSLTETTIFISRKIVPVSLLHLVLISLERYVAIKHPFAYQNKVTEGHIIIAWGLAWAAVVLFTLPIEELWMADMSVAITIAISLQMLIVFSVIVYCNVSVYKEVRRNQKQIAARQVSLEAKKRMLKSKKAFYTTIIVILPMFLCYVPVNICINIVKSFKESIPTYNAYRVLSLVSLLPVSNSLFNPLIYSFRMRYFRVAVIQLLSRKPALQAEELEKKIFRPRHIEVIADVELELAEQNIKEMRP